MFVFCTSASGIHKYPQQKSRAKLLLFFELCKRLHEFFGIFSQKSEFWTI